MYPPPPLRYFWALSHHLFALHPFFERNLGRFGTITAFPNESRSHSRGRKITEILEGATTSCKNSLNTKHQSSLGRKKTEFESAQVHREATRSTLESRNPLDIRYQRKGTKNPAKPRTPTVLQSLHCLILLQPGTWAGSSYLIYDHVMLLASVTRDKPHAAAASPELFPLGRVWTWVDTPRHLRNAILELGLDTNLCSCVPRWLPLGEDRHP